MPAPILTDLPSPAPAPARAGERLTVLVVAASELHGRRFAQSVDRLGHRSAGPVLGSGSADRLERLHRPDLCLIELPLDRPQPVFLLTPELRDRRETRGLGVRLAAPVTDDQLAVAIGLVRTRAAELRAVEREAAAHPAAVVRDLDALVHAKAVLRDRLATSEPHASHLLQRAAARRGERLADCARRVWALRATLTPGI